VSSAPLIWSTVLDYGRVVGAVLERLMAAHGGRVFDPARAPGCQTEGLPPD
jgi:hypothetical protein